MKPGRGLAWVVSAIVLAVGLGLLWWAQSGGVGAGVAPRAAGMRTAVQPPAGWDADSATVGAMAVLEQARNRLGIDLAAGPGEKGVAIAGVAGGAGTFEDREKVNELNLVFAAREGRLPVRFLWRHRLLNPKDRAPSPAERAELEGLVSSLEEAMQPVMSRIHEVEHAHETAAIAAGLVREYEGAFRSDQILFNGKAYLRSDFPPCAEAEKLREYSKFIAAEAVATMCGYFIARGYATWTPQMEELLVALMK